MGDNSRSDFGWQPSQGDWRGGGGRWWCVVVVVVRGGGGKDWNFGNFKAHPDLDGPHGVSKIPIAPVVTEIDRDAPLLSKL